MRDLKSMLLGTTATVLGLALAGLPASAAPVAPLATPQSYAELLAPIPNATMQLAVDDAVAGEAKAPLELVQYHHHHHHHHHHHFWGGFYGGGYAPPCYWTRGAPYWNGWRWVRPRVRVCD